MIVIVDYGLGNLFSVEKAFRRIGIEARISSDLNIVSSASRLVLPGVGHFAKGMKNLEERGLREALNKKVLQETTPVLGICLGMQLLLSGSDEGKRDGLNWISGHNVHFSFPPEERTKVPHLGWNNIALSMNDHPLFNGISQDSQFYFAHSYHASGISEAEVAAITTYGSTTFVSSVRKGHIMGVQFHPEKSHDRGLALLKNFAEHSYV